MDAATEVIDAGGYEQLTIRGLAAKMGVSPMSLYRYVRDKDDLVDEVVDRLLGPRWRPRAKPGDWRAWLAEAADRLRQFLVTQPAALHTYLHHPVVSPTAVERMDAMLEVLRGAGLSQREAQQAYAAVHTYTVGFAALEASRASWQHEDDQAGALAGKLAAYATPRQFREGLGYLLEAIERRAKAA